MRYSTVALLALFLGAKQSSCAVHWQESAQPTAAAASCRTQTPAAAAAAAPAAYGAAA